MPPPKRKSTTVLAKASSSSSKPQKDSSSEWETNPEDDEEVLAKEAADQVPKSNRWAPVSASGNIDHSYRIFLADKSRAHAWVCICTPSFAKAPKHDEDEDNEDDEDTCGTAACKCQTAISEYPDHPWMTTHAGYRKLHTAIVMSRLRTPDIFGMYTWNDHAAHGSVEVLQNLLLDFEEEFTKVTKSGKKEYDSANPDGWKDMWAVVSGAVMFLLYEGFQLMSMSDDPDGALAALSVLGRAFCTILAIIENKGLLQPDSELKDLALVMGMYIELWGRLDQASILERGEEKDFHFIFPILVLKYARAHDIPISEHFPSLDETIENLDIDPEEKSVRIKKVTGKNKDPYGFSKELRAYAKEHSTTGLLMPGPRKKSSKDPASLGIGGDNLDITTWTSKERKDAAFDQKDPFKAKDIKAIKDGMVINL